VRINLSGVKTVGKSGKAFVLESADLKAENSIDNPTKVAPVERPVPVSSSEFAFTLTPQSLTVLRIPVK
jgi:alpha-N-arabinofuranosidase